MIILPSRNVGVQCHHQIRWRHYVTAQLTSLRNMIISVLGLSETSLQSILEKQKKLFFICQPLLNILPPLPDIERISQATLLGIDITPLSTSVYVNKMLTQINQRLYLLSQLKLQVLNIQALHTLFTGLIIQDSRFKIVLFGNRKAKSKYNITVNWTEQDTKGWEQPLTCALTQKIIITNRNVNT